MVYLIPIIIVSLVLNRCLLNIAALITYKLLFRRASSKGIVVLFIFANKVLTLFIAKGTCAAILVHVSRSIAVASLYQALVGKVGRVSGLVLDLFFEG